MSAIRQALAAEAAKHGFVVDYADLRCGLFFLKRGTEVRSIGRCGRIPREMVPRYVDLTVRHGNRIDEIPGSRYFAGTATGERILPVAKNIQIEEGSR